MPRGIHNSPRGLATASQETRKRVSQIGGLVCYLRLGEEGVQARSEKGGTATAEKYGREYYTLIRQGVRFVTS